MPHQTCLWTTSRPVGLRAGSPLIYQWHGELTEHLFKLTHEYSIYSYFKGTKDILYLSTGERSAMSMFILFLYRSFPFIFCLHFCMFTTDMNGDMQALISRACSIRSAHFFTDTLSKPRLSCTARAKGKSHLSFVSTNTLIWGFHSWVSSRSSQKPRETQEMCVGPSVSPSSAKAQLILHGIFVSYQSAGACISQKEGREFRCVSTEIAARTCGHSLVAESGLSFVGWILNSVLYHSNTFKSRTCDLSVHGLISGSDVQNMK